MPEVIANEWFEAVFPTKVLVSEVPTDDPYAKTTDFSSEVEPLGVFSVRVTQMPIDPFIMVGPRQWVKLYGDHWPTNFAQYEPKIVHDESDAPLGGATRKLVVLMNCDVPCRAFVQLFAHPDGEVGRVVVAAAVVGLSSDEKAHAVEFLDSVQPKWAPAR